MTFPSIELISDVICPWCFIGLRRLEDALAEEGAASAPITFHPYQLDPSTPPEGADLRERLAAKYGGDPQAMFQRVEQAARESGIPLDFSLIARAGASDKGTQHALAKALFEAYFLEGKDIGADAVLVEIASAHGFDRAEAQALLEDRAALDSTRAEAEAMSRRGIRGVPFTIFGGSLAVSGAQPVDIFCQAFRRARGT